MSKKHKNTNSQSNNVNGVFSALEEVKQKKAVEIEKRRTERLEAQKRIFSVIGKPSHSQQYSWGKVVQRYTIDEVVFYLNKKYGAKVIPHEECYDYVLNVWNKVEAAKRERDPIGYMTDYYITTDQCVILLLPALQENEFRGRAPKNGCILFLGQTDGLCDYWILDGNTKGYKALWEHELYILEGDVIPMME